MKKHSIAGIIIVVTVICAVLTVIKRASDPPMLPLSERPLVIAPQGKLPLGGEAQWVINLAFSPNGHVLAASTNTTVQLWDATTQARLHEIDPAASLTGGYSGVLAWSPDGARLALGGLAGQSGIYDARTGTVLTTFTLPHQSMDFAAALAWSSQDLLAIASAGNRVDVVDGATYALRYSFLVPAAEVNMVTDVSFSPDGRVLVAGSWDGHVRMWSMVDGALLHDIVASDDRINAVAVNPAGTIVAAGGDDLRITVWSVATGTRETTLMGHSEDINTLVFHPDGTQLISGSGYFDDSTNESRDSTVRLWDVPTGHQIGIVGTHQYRIMDVALSPDGHHLASGGMFEGIKLWTIP
jgi:WD40 repeat protein